MPPQSDYRYTLEANERYHFDVISFKLTEGLSDPFKLELKLSGFEPDISFSALIDTPVTFTFWQGGQAVRYVNGAGDTGLRL